MKCFGVSSKVAFDPRLNSSIRMDADYLAWLQDLADAKNELDSMLARGEVPSISRKNIAKIISFLREPELCSQDYRRAQTLAKNVLASRTLAEAALAVKKTFRWDMPAYDELVAKAILDCARVEEQAKFDEAASRLNDICRKAEEWK